MTTNDPCPEDGSESVPEPVTPQPTPEVAGNQTPQSQSSEATDAVSHQDERN